MEAGKEADSSCSASCVGAESEHGESDVVIIAKWGSREVELSFTPTDFETFTVSDLKGKISEELTIPMDRQKLLGVTNCNGKAPQDGDLLSSLSFKKTSPKLSFMLMGTPLAQTFIDPSKRDDLPEVVNDLAWDYVPTENNISEIRNDIHLSRLHKAIEKTTITLIQPFRPKRKLLVLDLDYTVFDCKGDPRAIQDAKRPFLDHFMETVYAHYDIAVWSQTEWKWVEMKCTELGFLTSPKYAVNFVLDSRQKDGTSRTHEVKALEIIWAKFPDTWGPHNTLHVDDLSRNFAMNPKNGIKVSSYKMSKRGSDTELYQLSAYLAHVASMPDVSSIDHSKWKQVAKQLQDAFTYGAAAANGQ
ncbi:unnamed protein product [Vitrella brassicaformis CCMP3155]|uniref:protein-serine/threonine phosphatase n=1 Tax=Vitrella brassicaformis (strain CCMP3155) TaxID=1169540 RepID=A0A0G4EUK8_VITBC|nr:unnamed protein product [Vitrella brassicaformis CCMP3155]|eukprot:CEM01776.1 unnamed protein product [Vitrella brassicaformis CCMP3155]